MKETKENATNQHTEPCPKKFGESKVNKRLPPIITDITDRDLELLERAEAIERKEHENKPTGERKKKGRSNHKGGDIIAFRNANNRG